MPPGASMSTTTREILAAKGGTMGEKGCPASMTWDQRLYFPSEGRRAEDFFALKNPTALAGFEPATVGTKGQHATLRPPKPLFIEICHHNSFKSTRYGCWQRYKNSFFHLQMDHIFFSYPYSIIFIFMPSLASTIFVSTWQTTFGISEYKFKTATYKNYTIKNWIL